MEAAVPAVFFRDMAYSLQTDALSRTLGGEEHTVFFFYFPVIIIFDGQQYHMLGMQAG